MALARLRDLFTVVMLFGIYGFVSAAFFVVLDAVDVAFTEASVGAGVATIFMLGALALTKSQEKKPVHQPLLPLLVVCMTGAALIYGTVDLPFYGDPRTPIHHHVAPYYLQNALHDTGAPNVVTAVLASYRGYDTLGETTVIFTAAIGVLLLIGGARQHYLTQETKLKTRLPSSPPNADHTPD